MSAQRPIVLLVDDEDHILSALQRVLRREPYELITASNPREALTRLAARSVAVVVSDQRMRDALGIDFLREVAVRYPATKRVLLTGWPEEIAEDERAAAKLEAILPKPWDEAELKSTLLRCIS